MNPLTAARCVYTYVHTYCTYLFPGAGERGSSSYKAPSVLSHCSAVSSEMVSGVVFGHI